MTAIVVNSAAGAYAVSVGTGLLQQLDSLLHPGLPRQHAIVVTDQNVAEHWLAPVATSLERCFNTVHSVNCPPGEESKSVEMAFRLWEQLLEFSADRQSVIVALGGGVIGDLAGFVAATFMRGLPLVQIPTTLLAQVDSSVGGKTGINLPSAKNMVGAFWPPRQVIIDPAVLATLSEREFAAGMAEVVKYGVIQSEDLFAWLEANVDAIRNRDPQTLEWMISRCCQQKAAVVEADEFETGGQRVTLNYGHTFGHAIEAVAGYGVWLHGEAVATGMNCAARMAEILGLSASDSPDPVVERQAQLLQQFGLPLRIDALSATALVEAMKHDKKKSGGPPRLVLPTAIGAVKLVEWPGDDRVRKVWVETGASE